MQLRLQQQLIYNTHILTAKHKILTNTYKYLQILTNTYKYLQILTNTYKYLQILTNTYK